MTGRWITPVDPGCPVVERFLTTLYDDPMTAVSGCGGEIAEHFERRHRLTCERCQTYGAANVDVDYGGRSR